MLRCASCGRENPDENRFCGQCGAALARPQSSATYDEPRTVSGPSFLGLGDPEPYRYEDDEEEVERSSWRAWLVLAVLLVVGGLLWMQWRYATTLRSALNDVDPRPSAVQTEPATEPQPPETPAEGEAAPSDPAAEGQTAEDAPSPSQQATTPEPEGNKPDSDAAEPAAETATREEGEAAPQEEEAPAETEGRPTEKLEKENTVKGGGEKEPAKPATTESDADLAIARRALAAGDTEEAVRRLWASTSKGSSVAPVLLATMYLEGDGVERSCEQALVLLNSAARRNNAQARARLGQMYADGQCAQKDRVAAYHWYTLALNAAPDDESIRRRRDNLWTTMTEMEREEARALAR